MQHTINLTTQTEQWRDQIVHQVQLQLSSVRRHIVRLEITLATASPPGEPSRQTIRRRYHCRLVAELQNGRREVLTAASQNVQFCVSSVLARLHRLVRRERQMGMLGQTG